MVWKHYNRKGKMKMKDQCMLSKAQRHEMLCINRQNGDKLAQAVGILTDIRNVLRRAVAQDQNIVRKPRQSRDQLRQLSIALEVVERDPVHNVKRAAELAFRNTKGYASIGSLEYALRRKWNSRK